MYYNIILLFKYKRHIWRQYNSVVGDHAMFNSNIEQFECHQICYKSCLNIMFMSTLRKLKAIKNNATKESEYNVQCHYARTTGIKREQRTGQYTQKYI